MIYFFVIKKHMVHYNKHNKYFANSKNLSPEQFQQIYKAKSPLEFYLNIRFKDDIRALAMMKNVIESCTEEERPKMKILFEAMRFKLQKKVDEATERAKKKL